MGIESEGAGCLQVQKIRATCNKLKKSISLENANNVATYVVHIDANWIKLMCKFCDRVFDHECSTPYLDEEYDVIKIYSMIL